MAERTCCCSTSRPTTWTSTPAAARGPARLVAGTIVVVSHDRYLVERVCDSCSRCSATAGSRTSRWGREYSRAGAGRDRRGTGEAEVGAGQRAARKELTRLERRLDALGKRRRVAHGAGRGRDRCEKLLALDAELRELLAERRASSNNGSRRRMRPSSGSKVEHMSRFVDTLLETARTVGSGRVWSPGSRPSRCGRPGRRCTSGPAGSPGSPRHGLGKHDAVAVLAAEPAAIGPVVQAVWLAGAASRCCTSRPAHRHRHVGAGHRPGAQHDRFQTGAARAPFDALAPVLDGTASTTG